MKKPLLLLIFFCLISLTGKIISSAALAEDTPQILINGNILTKFYDEKSGYNNRSEYIEDFGPWAVRPVGNSIYLTLSGTPNHYNGAQLIRFENNSLTNLPVINKGNDQIITEQGINYLYWSETLSKLIIPGTDPNDKNNWEWGTMYTYNPGASGINKYREGSGLNGVVHIWGIDEHKGSIYIAAHSTSGNKIKVTEGIGEILKSSDQGQTWQRVTVDKESAKSPSDFFGGSVIDIKSLNNSLYVFKINNNVAELQISKDDGKTWKKIDSMIPYTMPRMVEFQGKILYVGRFANTISTIDINDAESLHGLPQKTTLTFNNIATDGKYVYYLAENSKVYYSNNLDDWSIFEEFDSEKLTSIAYWPEKKGLVIAARGKVPNIYLIPQIEEETPLNKTCSVIIDKNSFIEGETIRGKITAKSGKNPSETARLLLKKVDNSKINPIPDGSNLIENIAAGTNYYLLEEAMCQTGNNQSCSGTAAINSLAPGKYQLHCDLPEEPQKCSGNPNCSYNGGPFACEGWQSCGEKDFVNFTVNKKEEKYPNKPDYNNSGIVDIYDYSLLAENYKKTNCDINLIGNCTVDSVDLNNLIAKFGF